MTADAATNEATNIGGTQRGAPARRRPAGRRASTTSRRSRSRGSTTARSPRTCSTRASTCRRRTTRRSSRRSGWSASRPRSRGGSTGRRSSSVTRETGAMDKIDGPYYFFPALAGSPSCRTGCRWSGRTSATPMSCRSTSSRRRWTHLMHVDGLDGRAFHLVSPEPQPLLDVVNAFSAAAGGPVVALPIDRRIVGAGRGRCSRCRAGARRHGRAERAARPAGDPAGGRPALDVPSGLRLDATTRRALRGSGVSRAAARGVRRRAVAVLGRQPRLRCGPAASGPAGRSPAGPW